jgi:hypothetical protein
MTPHSKACSPTNLYADACFFRQFCSRCTRGFRRLPCVFKRYGTFTFTAQTLLKPGEKCLMTGSIVIKLVAVLLSVLSLSAAAFSAADISFPDDSSQTCQDDAGLLALVGSDVPLIVLCKAETYLSYKEQKTFHQQSIIFCHTYRGPPTC